jgi:predicted nucleotidyltransferase
MVFYGDHTMLQPQDKARANRKERIDVSYDYAVCAWARHFNVSEKRVKEAVAAVGDEADKVREHLKSARASERPSSH